MQCGTRDGCELIRKVAEGAALRCRGTLICRDNSSVSSDCGSRSQFILRFQFYSLLIRCLPCKLTQVKLIKRRASRLEPKKFRPHAELKTALSGKFPIANKKQKHFSLTLCMLHLNHFSIYLLPKT